MTNSCLFLFWKWRRRNYSSKNPWQILAYFFSENEEEEENTNANTIEWTLASPIPLHAFDNLAVQS